MKVEYRNELGECHRTDGSDIEHTDGSKVWWINGLKHREDGPAVEGGGYKAWYINGKRHRTDGPAVEYSDGDNFWYLNDIEYSEEEFHQEIIKLKLKRLIEL
jgi:hypothetical protein